MVKPAKSKSNTRIPKWVADTQIDVAATVFGVPEKTIKEFPEGEVFVSGGNR